MMLNCIAPELDDKKLLTFVRSHFSSALDQPLDEDQMSLDDASDIEESFTQDIFAQFKESPIFNELKSNFTQNIVLAAMVMNSNVLNDENEDINGILTDWCMEHEDEEMKVEEILDNFKSNQSKPKPLSSSVRQKV